MNFLSTGNTFTEIALDARLTTLIVGENGSGKSTLLDAVCFALFGKPYRNINKPQLVNSINGKNCVVEIEFSIGKKFYRVIRGIKPTIFEIWIDNVLVNQDAASRDYQKYLEDSILKLNFKSFTQIVILGSTSFTPFMQLPAAERREVIEDILDIKIFSSMNIVLKDKVQDLNSKLSNIETKITIAKNKAEVQKEYIKNLEEDRDARIHNINVKIQEAVNEIAERKHVLWDIEDKREGRLQSIGDAPDVNEDIGKILQEMREFESTATTIEKEISFYHNNDTCPKCKQGIAHDFKKDIVNERSTDLKKIHETMSIIQERKYTLQNRLEDIQTTNKEFQ
jgi:DNA repair exonuclease SbcCD ATPase subunit